MSSSMLTALDTHVYVMAAILFLLLLYFALGFGLPAIGARKRLTALRTAITAIPSSGADDLTPVFENEPTLKHQWMEFQETLHQVCDVNPRTGALEVQAL